MSFHSKTLLKIKSDELDPCTCYYGAPIKTHFWIIQACDKHDGFQSSDIDANGASLFPLLILKAAINNYYCVLLQVSEKVSLSLSLILLSFIVSRNDATES